ncbi:MAG TPA: DNA polymerase III subunit beta [Candidatus Paceibacterota bacterium]|nr:DNA polymerase III subunit beta [Candidatus Paceibacterota bacterium]
MNIIVHRDNLDRALGIVERVTAKNAALPILSNILLRAENGHLFLSATNLEIGVTAVIGAKTEKEGRIAVPGRILSDLVRASKTDTVSLMTNQNTLDVKAGEYKTSILCFDAGEYPIIPKLDGGTVVNIPIHSFQSLLAVVADSISNSDARPELAGALFRTEKNSITLAATDSFRLVEKNSPHTEDSKVSVIIPRSAVMELLRITTGLSGDVVLRIASNQIAVSHPEFELVSRLIDGKYPDYQKVIPDRSLSRVLVDKEELMSAIRIAALFSSSVSDVKIECNDAALLVSARNASRGEGQASTKANLKGDTFEISLNHHYVMDGLKIIPTKNVVIEYTGKGSPFVLRPDDGDTLVYLVMPLRG